MYNVLYLGISYLILIVSTANEYIGGGGNDCCNGGAYPFDHSFLNLFDEQMSINV